MKLVRRRVPLPLADVHNSRSLVYVGNLASAIEELLRAHPAAAGTFLVSDNHDLSTPELVGRIAQAMNVEPRLWHCPLPLLTGLARIAGRGDEIRRMVESLTVDSSRIRQSLHWNPPFTVCEGLSRTADWFMGGYAALPRG
jgi:nucleoside-diphosphate-sugar epimerase